MTISLQEIEAMACELSVADRAKLAAAMLESLDGPLEDDDYGVAEAIKRSKEMDENPEMVLSHEEFLKAFQPKV